MALAGTPGTYYQLNNFAVTSGGEVDFDFNASYSGDTVTFYVPFMYGTAFTFEPVIRTAANFYLDFNSTPYTATVNFLDTATLQSALVFSGTPGSLGSQNNSAGINSSSGLIYGPNGVFAPAPEPGSWLMLSSAIGALVFLNRRRDRKEV
jgi:hypothetical protein